MGQRFIWVLLACSCNFFMNAIRSGAIQGMSLSNIRWKDLLGPSWCAKRLDRGETLKHPFQTDAVASSWFNQSRDERRSKTRPRNKHQIIRQIGVDDRSEAYMSHRENHEASVTSHVYEIRPKTRRPFRRMLTSADRLIRVGLRL